MEVLALAAGIVLVVAVLALGRWILVRPLARTIVDRGGSASPWIIGALIVGLIIINLTQINGSTGGVIGAIDFLVFLLCIGWALSHRR